jgi:hypothetical protein
MSRKGCGICPPYLFLQEQASALATTSPGSRRWKELPALDSVHRGSRSEPFILVAQLGDLKKGVHTITFKTVNFQASRPVF